MSFSAYANHVRNPGLPHRQRVSALRSCVQLYGPLGFEASLSFLAELAGPFRHDEAALLRALDALAASRGEWHAQLRAYAAVRRDAKRRGQRRPPAGEPNPNRGPRYWYGARRRGALHALGFWQRYRVGPLLAAGDPHAARVLGYVAACLAAQGALSPAERDGLAEATGTLRRRFDRGWDGDFAEFDRARQLLTLARFIEAAADGEGEGAH